MRNTIIDQAPEGQYWEWVFLNADGYDVTGDIGSDGKATFARVIITEGRADLLGSYVVTFRRIEGIWTIQLDSDVFDLSGYDPEAYADPRDFRILDTDLTEFLAAIR
jgi:hypothetical protein